MSVAKQQGDVLLNSVLLFSTPVEHQINPQMQKQEVENKVLYRRTSREMVADASYPTKSGQMARSKQEAEISKASNPRTTAPAI
jgi:hypothetical protein